ncbi:MAG TPA: DUF1080 domain-containing protein [Polyangiales bacterium]|nr:DUF1080 domain-containing protein [Polyangiales bacterium]
MRWPIAVLILCCWGCGGDEPSKPKPSRDPDSADAGKPDAGEPDASLPDPQLELSEWRPLFDATLSEWYRFLPSHGRDADPDGVFRMEGSDVLHVLGNAPPAGDQEFGYVATRSDYGNYRFRVEQRWGTTKFAPRQDAVRDSGLLYHMRGDDGVWPQCMEFQVQENDVGDLYLLGDVGATTPVDPMMNGMFQEGGDPRVLRGGAIKKGGTYESLTDWNALELVASEREFIHSVNQVVNHRGWAMEFASGGMWQPLDRGRIVLQAEGAEVFYRNARIRPLAYPPPPADAVVVFDGTNLDAWEHLDHSAPRWKIVDGALEIEPGSDDLLTREQLQDIRLHLEFRLPVAADARTQVYAAGRYGLLLANSYGHPLSRATSGTLVDAPPVDEALPAEVWQSVDMVFRNARWDETGKVKTRNARITVVYNGSLLYEQLELKNRTANGWEELPGNTGLRLRDEGFRVRFRNIWFQRL